jgi:ankyrin repeat protein
MKSLFDSTITATEIKARLSIGATPDEREIKENGRTPISKFAEEKRWDLVDAFASKDYPVDPNDDKAQYGDALLLALIDAQYKLAKKLIKAGASLTWNLSDTRSYPIHLIVESGDRELFRFLLAAQLNFWDMVTILANALGKDDAFNSYQYLEVISLAQVPYQDKVVAQLTALKSKDEFNTLTREQFVLHCDNRPLALTELENDSTLIQRCMDVGRWDLVEVLADNYKHDIEDDDKYRYGDALLTAMEEGKIPLVKKLVAAGASASWFLPDDNSNIIHLIVRKKDNNLLRSFLNLNADIKHINDQGNSPILLAAEQKSWGTVEVLAEKLKTLPVTNEDIVQYKDVYLLWNQDPTATDVPNFNELKISIEKQYVAQFIKIYNALHEAQTSAFKSHHWKSVENLDMKTILEYVAMHPKSRSAQALELTDMFLATDDKKYLVQAIHKIGLGKSSSLGIFKQSKNSTGLNSLVGNDFADTYKGADVNSRTGKIRKSLDDDIAQGPTAK